MAWIPCNTPGTLGSEGGVVLRDEEHEIGARISIERDCTHAPFAITCGIYGWFFHTRYVGSEGEATSEYEKMKDRLAAIVKSIPCVDDLDHDEKFRLVRKEIKAFVEMFL